MMLLIGSVGVRRGKLRAERRDLMKNEATDLLDNKGLALGRIRNEPTVWGRKVAHAQELKEFEYTTNPYYRATLLAPTHPQPQIDARSEGSNFRKVESLTRMRIRAKTPHPNPPVHTQYEGTSHDVHENKGSQKSLLEHPTMLMKKKVLIFVVPRSP